jgi:malonyl-CoA/methylmalonyl-CoA synthetase
MGSISPTPPFEGSVKDDARTFPNELPFTHLLKTASQKQEHIVIKDTTLGVDANYAQLLTDILHMRDVLREQLPASMLDGHGLIVETTPYIFIVAPVNYEFIVTFLAILSLGGAFVAMR